jgi:hypothetical protein
MVFKFFIKSFSVNVTETRPPRRRNHSKKFTNGRPKLSFRESPTIVYAVPTDIKSLTQSELQTRFAAWDQPAYRVAQLLNWLYARRVTSWDAMTNLPKVLREKLAANFTLHTHELTRKQGSRDTTQKFLWKLADGAFIESVLIPANPALYGEASDRHTLCISTQVGCAYGCKFWPWNAGAQTSRKSKVESRAKPALDPRPSTLDSSTTSSSWAWANRSRTTTTCSRRSAS